MGKAIFLLDCNFLGRNIGRVTTSGTIDPPVPLSLAIVGKKNVKGDIDAGHFSLLDLRTMKQVVGESEEATDGYKEYLGEEIEWSVTGGGAEMQTSEGTYGVVSVLEGADETECVVTARVGDYSVSKTFKATYLRTDYLISTFADLKAIETAVYNRSEASISIVKTSSYSPSNGGGFAGARFRLTNDIDCGGSHTEIGEYNTSTGKTQFFAGTIDGCGYSLYNIGGNCGVNGGAAQGGKVASVLVCHGKNCTISNLKLYGSVTNVASRGFGGVCAMIEGEVHFENLYNAVQIGCNSSLTCGETVFVGWSVDSSAFAYMEDCVFAGSILAHYSINGFSAAKAELKRCANIGKVWCEITTRASSNIALLEGSGITGGETSDCFTIAGCKVSRSSGTYGFGAAAVTYPYSRNCYENNVYEFSVSGSKVWSIDATTTGSLSVNNLGKGATAVDVETLKNETLLTGESWIHAAGFMPLIDNEFAVDPVMLDRVANGYTEL